MLERNLHLNTILFADDQVIIQDYEDKIQKSVYILTFRHRASCILGQAFHYTPENAFYIFNQQIYFII